MALVAVLSAGCRATTTVAVVEDASGKGQVTVEVGFDQAAVGALGGLDSLRSDLQTADLTRTGWAVAGPAPSPSDPGGAVVRVAHRFSSPAEASALLSSVAGTGPAAGRPFRLSLVTHRTFWHVTASLHGAIDLRCGISCFGDAALAQITGSPVGVDAGALVAGAGEQPGQALTFHFAARLPGTERATNATSRQAATLQWEPVLGHVIDIESRTTSLNTDNVTLVVGGAGAVLVAAVVVLGVALVIRRRRRALSSAEPPSPASTASEPPGPSPGEASAASLSEESPLDGPSHSHSETQSPVVASPAQSGPEA